MIHVSSDAKNGIVSIEFQGKIDSGEAARSFSELERILPKDGQRFKLLVDMTGLESMEIEVEAEIKKAMKLVDARGVIEVVRVIGRHSEAFRMQNLDAWASLF